MLITQYLGQYIHAEVRIIIAITQINYLLQWIRTLERELVGEALHW